MSVYKTDKSPYWQYDFQRAKRRFFGSTGCTTRRDAEAFESKLKREIALGLANKRQITLDDACQLYWRTKGQHEASHKTTDYQLANIAEGIGPTKMLAEIKLSDFNKYVAKRRAHVSNASVNREWQLARRVWKLAKAEEYQVSEIEWAKLELDEPKERVRELTTDEQKRLFENLPRDIAQVVEFALLSGQRRSAVVTLQWDHVDLEGRRAVIILKGGNPHTFPLTPSLVEIIKRQPRVEKCDFVFTYECERHAPARKDRPKRVKGQRYPFSKQGWMRKWRKAVQDAKIKDFRFHDLRHTRATRMLRATGNLKTVQKLLGHTDIGTTARYAHALEDDIRDAMVAGESRNSTGQELTDSPENGRNPSDSEVTE